MWNLRIHLSICCFSSFTSVAVWTFACKGIGGGYFDLKHFQVVGASFVVVFPCSGCLMILLNMHWASGCLDGLIGWLHCCLKEWLNDFFIECIDWFYDLGHLQIVWCSLSLLHVDTASAKDRALGKKQTVNTDSSTVCHDAMIVYKRVVFQQSKHVNLSKAVS